MTAAILSEAPTLADLHKRLGSVPLARILLRPLPGTATEADVVALANHDNKRLCELLDGTLVEKAMGFPESILAGLLLTALNNFVRPRKLGIVAGADGLVRLWPGRVRIPDLVYISWARLAGNKGHREQLLNVAPELVAEVLSPSNTRAEMTQKLDDYFRADVLLVWEIDPDARQIAVYTAPEQPTVLTVTDTLDGGSVLPGFAMPVAELFASDEEADNLPADSKPS